jgi:hypothetical protein
MSEEQAESVNVDQIISDSIAPEPSREVSTEGDLSAKDTESTEQESQASSDFMIKHNGQEFNLNDEKYKMYAQKGFDYEQKMHQLRVDKKLWDQERKTQETGIEELRTINDYAKQNPEFERLLKREWNRIQGGGQAQPESDATRVDTSQLPPAVQHQMNAILERLDSQDRSLNQRSLAEKEAKIEGAIEQYKNNYSDFDWKTKDEFGQTLEDRVTQHAIDNQIRDFKTAANDMLFEEHMKRAQLKSKELAGKEMQKQHKLGLGKVTKESVLATKPAEGIRTKSYNDLAMEALQELGL